MFDIDRDIKRIATVICGYGKGLGENHVKRWLSQFDNQEVIALETARLLEKYYVTNAMFNEFAYEIHQLIYNNLGLNDDIYLLNLQGSTKSQSYLTNLLMNIGGVRI